MTKGRGKKRVFRIVLTVLLAVVLIAAMCLLYLAGLYYIGPFKGLAVNKITQTYDAKQQSGEIVFYGASNFAFWTTMQADIPQYAVQNHGFGGSDDADLMRYADKLLFPYAPVIVVFQTGSNDYVNAQGSDAEKLAACMERKKEMFSQFHEALPDAQIIVLSGLLLPGRSEYLDLTQQVNDQLEALCAETDYLTFVRCDALSHKNGVLDSTQFVEDGIHLTPEARIVWANDYIIPALDSAMAKAS